jgi:hypothetical protein
VDDLAGPTLGIAIPALVDALMRVAPPATDLKFIAQDHRHARGRRAKFRA